MMDYAKETREWDLKVRVKKLDPRAVIPTYAKPGDAGLDLTAIEAVKLPDGIRYHTGLAFEIPEGYVGFIYQRSSIRDKDIILSNCVGVIDSGYRGEISFTYKFHFGGYKNRIYQVGDRIGQIVIMPYPRIELVESDELSETERGMAGFGSSGN